MHRTPRRPGARAARRSRPRGPRQAGAWGALGAGACLALTGFVALGTPSAVPAADAGTVPAVVSLPDEPGAGQVETTRPWPARLLPPAPATPSPRRSDAPPPTAVARPVSRPAPPARLELPRLGVSARIEPVGVGSDGQLGVPEHPDVLGWWREGARPGEGRGSVVVDGHVDSAELGLGVFVALAELEPGDTVRLVGSGGREHRYSVTGRRLYPRAALPARRLFSQAGAERLVLVTCGGEYDDRAGAYTHNVVVFAVPAS